MLEATWAGYDQLKQKLLNRIDVSQADEELERAVTQLLEPKIRDQLTGEEPFTTPARSVRIRNAAAGAGATAGV